MRFVGLIALVSNVCWSATAHAEGVDDVKQACVAAADDGQALRDDGKYTASREQFVRCADVDCPEIVRQQCTIWLKQVIDATPTVVLGARDGHGRDIVTARVFADGRLVTELLDGTPLELDAGPHELRFEAPDGATQTMKVVLRAGDKNRSVSAELAALPDPTLPRKPAPAPRRASLGDARSVTSLALLGAGALAAGAGGLFALAARRDADDGVRLRKTMNNSACFETNSAACSALSNAVDAQARDATASTVLYASGGALVVASLVTWLAWPNTAQGRAQSARSFVLPAVGPAYAGLTASTVLP